MTTIVSYQGAEHWDAQKTTFILLGPEREGLQYVRDIHGEYAVWLRTTYDATASLPRRATDTGYSRDGRRLWLDAEGEAAYLVSLEDRTDIERWPAAQRPIFCG